MDINIQRRSSIAIIALGIVSVVVAMILNLVVARRLSRVSTYRRSVAMYGRIICLPTRKHRQIINVLFLLPLLFAFAFTVIIPFVFGVFYSFTDWNGIKFDQFVGLENYITMFTSQDYVYSLLITIVFATINILLVNFVALSLALLCTSKIKGRNFLSSGIFCAESNRWNCAWLCLAVYFQ